MKDLLRWLASWRDVPVEHGTELHVELSGFPSGGLGLLVILGVLGAIAIVWFTYVRDARRLSRGRRLVLTFLRAFAVLIATLLLLDPQIVAVRRDVQPGHALVLVDTSQSMAQADAFREPDVLELAAAWRTLGVEEPGETARIDLARQLLGRDDQAALRALRAHNRVLVYGFSAGLEPLGTLEFERPVERAADREPTSRAGGPQRLELDTIRAEGSYTNIGGAVREALARSGTANVAGLVLLTDGRRNLGAQGPEVARLLRNRGVPHVVVAPIGDPSPTRTLRVLRMDAPEKVFQKDPFTVGALIEGRGYEDVEFSVRLSRETAEGGEPETLGVQTVRIDADSPEAAVTFEGLRTSVPGAATYILEVVPPDLEVHVRERHVRRARIEALAERTRVLLIAGGPNHEYRILRNLLTRDDTIELACWLSSADPGFLQDGNLSLEELPKTREELETWDVFVLLDPDADRLDVELCERISEQITENGAGLWWVCGEKFTLRALRESSSTRAIADLLPVVPDLRAADGSIGLARGMERAWSYDLTAQGRAHPAVRIAEERGPSEALWARLPGFHFAFPVERAKPVAQVLVTHRKPRALGDTETDHPLIATQFVGAGRVLFTATDDVYRWRSVHEAAYDRLWVRGIRYLFEGRLNAGNSRLRVFVEEERIELGQAVKVVAEVRDEAFEPLLADAYELVVRAQDQASEQLLLESVDGAPGRYEAWLRPAATGWFDVEAVDAPKGRPVGATFEVIAAALEKEGPVDLAELGAIAAAPGGVLLSSPATFFDALDRIPSQSRIETFTSAQTLWDSWASVALLVGTLTLEWWLRKRSNLL